MSENPVIKEFKIDGVTYVYDFERLSIDQALQAEMFFRLNDRMYKVLPSTPSDVETAGAQMALRHGYACLLVKQNEDGTLETFNPALTNNLKALNGLKGTKARQELEECKDDFFLRSGLVTDSSMQQLTSLIRVVKEMPREEQQLMFSLIYGTSKELAGLNSEPTFTIPEPSPVGQDT